MVRHYVAHYIESYVSQNLSFPRYSVLALALCGIAAFLSASAFAAQLGVVLLAHIIVKHLSGSWITLFLAAIVVLTFFSWVLVHGVYEVLLFMRSTLRSKNSLLARVGMLGVFSLDFFLSDVILVAGGVLLATAYLSMSFAQSWFPVDTLVIPLFACLTGVLFQMSFVSSYSHLPVFSKVVSESKKFFVQLPQTCGERALYVLYRTITTLLPPTILLLLSYVFPSQTNLLTVILRWYALALLLLDIVRASILISVTVQHRLHHIAAFLLRLAYDGTLLIIALTHVIDPVMVTVAVGSALAYHSFKQNSVTSSPH